MDLVQEGCLALDGCVDRFEPCRGSKFLSYAAPVIRNTMQDAVAVAQSRFEGRYANDLVRLDSLRQEDKQPFSNFVADPYQQDPERIYLRKETIQEVHAALQKSGARLRIWMFCRFGLPAIRSTPWRKRHGIFICWFPEEKPRIRWRCRRYGGII